MSPHVINCVQNL